MCDNLSFGRLTANSVHLCLDMQRLFSREGPWPTPWMESVLPTVATLAERHSKQTIFTRFRTPWSAESASGQWQHLYAKWPQVTQRECDPTLFELIEPLQKLVPPATILDKTTYSAFSDPLLKIALDGRRRMRWSSPAVRPMFACSQPSWMRWTSAIASSLSRTLFAASRTRGMTAY
jgi:nicotinamidase-related amidase